jgi:hypothetical protein
MLQCGLVSVMNRKLGRWQEERRLGWDQPYWGEWFQWLGDQTGRRKTGKAPAYLEHRDWR